MDENDTEALATGKYELFDNHRTSFWHFDGINETKVFYPQETYGWGEEEPRTTIKASSLDGMYVWDAAGGMQPEPPRRSYEATPFMIYWIGYSEL